MTSLALDRVSVKIKDAALLDRVSVQFNTGELVAIVGPNGAGKSTLVKTILGAIRPTTGSATINGIEAADMAPIDRARLISYLPQIRDSVWPIKVRDAVALGRFAYGTSMQKLDKHGSMAVQNAIDNCKLQHLAERRTDMLSGGEQARVHCARVFASEAPLLVADEPITALDPAGQLDVLTLIRQHVDHGTDQESAQGTGAIIILHDLTLAASIADRMIWMRESQIVADGPPSETVTVERIRQVFDVTASVETGNGPPFIRYLSR